MKSVSNISSTESVTELLKTCSEKLDKTLPYQKEQELLQWHQSNFATKSRFQIELLNTHPLEWDKCVASHRAHKHEWYNFLITTIDVDHMATFLLENINYPAFLPLLEKIMEVQFLADAKDAVQENIDDEFQPEPHAQLMRKLMMAVKDKAKSPVDLYSYSSLNDRTLVFYYGYYLQPWHLVGSLFATEQMGSHRVTCMKKGLERIGLTEDELEFTTVHSECDDHHADDWLKRVIVPSIESKPELLPLIAEGMAECLETSAVYLDYLLERAQLRIAG